MGEVVQHTKDTWLSSIETSLTQLGFTKVDNGFERVHQQRHGGQVITINGQRMEQPGQIVTVKNVVTFNGDGWLVNEDDTNKREFTQVVFEVFTNGNSQGSAEQCMYWDSPDDVIKTVKQIF